MEDEKIIAILNELSAKLPKFPDGRIDFTNSDIAPVISVFVKFKDKILLLKRSDKVSTYKRKWNTVAGYIDELKTIREKALEELREEISIFPEHIAELKIGQLHKVFDENINKTWLVHTVLAELKEQPEIHLDWEHTSFLWIKLEEINNFDIVPRLDEDLRRVLGA